ncbi:MAG: aldose 1-epimerase family protein [Mycetocola sp.]
MSLTPLSGQQFDLEFGAYRASIASIGASVRSLTWNGRDLVRPFEADEVRPAFRGAILAPWPNRVINGAYTWDGADQQLALTEPARGHALHGLVVWQDFELCTHSPTELVLATVVQPQQGYPHRVRVQVSYRLDEQGLHTRVSLENLSAADAPVGWGSHSYLVAPGERVDEWLFELNAATVQDVTADRLIPVAVGPVQDHPGGLDFRTARLIGDTFVDHAFTDLTPESDGLLHATLTDAAGDGVGMVWDASSPWVQIHTADLPEAELSRRGLAVEPMSCPPGAFDSATDIVRLASGESVSSWWLISAVTGPSAAS